MPIKHQISLEKLLKTHWANVHACLFLCYGERVDIVKREHTEFSFYVLHQARREKFERYADIWLYRLLINFITSRYHKVKRQFETESFASDICTLKLDQRLILIIRDRIGLDVEQTAAVLQLTPWAVERRTFHAREKLGEHLAIWKGEHPFLSNPELSSLHVRVVLNRHLNKELPQELHQLRQAVEYRNGLQEVQNWLRNLPVGEVIVEVPDLKDKKIPLWKKGASEQSFSWIDTPWHYKLVLEGVGFAAAGALAVFLLPMVLSYYNKEPTVPQKPVKKIAQLTGSSTMKKKPTLPTIFEEDPFSEVEFPSGHEYHRGAAPLAPSRRKGNIYRLIIQSANPKDLIPQMQRLFADANVSEREDSGREMPGGVYFDGITTEGEYNQIEAALKAMGKTRTFANRPQGRRVSSAAQARVIIWIQQI